MDYFRAYIIWNKFNNDDSTCFWTIKFIRYILTLKRKEDFLGWRTYAFLFSLSDILGSGKVKNNAINAIIN